MNKLVPRGPHSVPGIDISHYQPVVNFTQVAAAGNKFAFIKATEGASGRDDRYELHHAEAKAAGVLVGAYHFLHYTDDPRAQAKNLCSVMGDTDLPPVLDVEWQGAQKIVGRSALTVVLPMLEEMEQLTGKTPIIYTSGAFFIGEPNPHAFTKYPLWIASYRSDGAIIPDVWSSWKFWQYTDHRAVPGVGKIDGNLFNGTLDDLHRFCGKQPPKGTAAIKAEAEETFTDPEIIGNVAT